MPFYRCVIRGEHFPGECVGKSGPYGFYTTRWLEAGDEAEAELRAVAMLRDDPSFALPQRLPKPTDARVYVEELEEVSDLPDSRGGGTSWFREDETNRPSP